MLPRIQRVLVTVAMTVIGGAVLLPSAPAAAHTSDLPFEVRFPQEMEKTEFSSTFGAPRSGGRTHQGVDLMAPKMTEVYAFADGTITIVTTSRLAGRYLVIEHSDAWETYYIHLNDDTPGTSDGRASWLFTVAEGIEVSAEVVAGQLIGWVGDSGNAKGGSPHTHFELHYQGRPIDPYPYLVSAWEQDHLERLQDHLERLQARLPLRTYKID